MLLAQELARSAGRPLVTYDDDLTGERTELSLATFDNWVAKTANLLVDTVGLGPGGRVGLLLPLHWQTAVWLAACWRVGATACLGAADDVDLAVAGPDTVEAALAADEVVALSLRPWGAPFATALPAGVLDYAAEVPGHGDRFATPAGAVPELTEVDGARLDGPALLAAAADAAARWSLPDRGRLLSTLDPASRDGALALLAAPLAVGGSVVLARHYAPGTAATRLAGERCDAVAG